MSLDLLNKFIKYTVKEINLNPVPKIHFVGHQEDTKRAFGHTDKKDIYVRVVDRHPVDIMRTLAHELVHCKEKSNKASLAHEDKANAMAGRIMRNFGTKNPDIFKAKIIKSINEDGMTTSVLAANHMGASSSTPGTGGIDTLDPLLKIKPLRRLRDIIGRDLKNDKRSDKRY